MAPSARSNFGHDTTTDEVLAGIDLTGKLALVTGGSSGLGAETARALAAHGAAVVLTVRDLAKGEAVAADIRGATGNDNVTVARLELDSLASVREFAQGFLAAHDSLNLLINNAGVMACPYAQTRDGFEMQFGTNHLGHFLLTALLKPALLATSSARVVALSSRAHHMASIDFEDIHFARREYHKWVSYGQSKTANALFAYELNRQLAPQGVTAFSVHPGVIFTELSRHMDEADFEMMQARAAEMGAELRTKSIPAGAATSVYAATAPELVGHGGVYLEDCGIAAVNDAENASEGVRSYALDPDLARKLWTVSEEMVGQSFA